MRSLFFFLMMGFLCANMLLNTVQPEIDTTLALNQFENPSVTTDTFYRKYGYISVFFNVSALVCFSLYIYLSFIGKKV